MKTKLAILVASMGLIWACGPMPAEQAPQEEGSGYRGTSLYVDSTRIWRPLSIPVCWENSGWSTEKAWMRDAIQRSWARQSLISFTGWARCSSGSRGLRVRVQNDGGYTRGLGTRLDGRRNGVNLNTWGTAASPRSCTNGFSREDCVRSTAVHEFGHALGFAHEHNRGDTPDSCTRSPQGSNGDTTVGPWDRDSVMNYCNPVRNGRGMLSDTDILGLQRFYGDPASPMQLLVRDGNTRRAVNSTLCGANTIQARVTPFNGLCTRTQIELWRGSTVVRTVNAAVNSWATLNVSAYSGRLQVRASCREYRKFKTIYRDTQPPSFTSLRVNNRTSGWASNPVRLNAVGVSDDGGTSSSRHRMVVHLDNVYRGTFAGTGATLGALTEGRHTARAYLRDSCGRVSASRSLAFRVDGRRPTLSFIKPATMAVVRRNHKLKIELRVGDPGVMPADADRTSGVSVVKVYLDGIPTEFSTGRQLCQISGPWPQGFAVNRSCTVSANFSAGSHTLIAVAYDRAGNSTKVERRVRITAF